MKIKSVLYESNELMEEGRLDEQIIRDINKYIDSLLIYQCWLDTRMKGKDSHYETWTKQNQDKIQYMNRIVQAVENSKNIPVIVKTPGKCPNCGSGIDKPEKCPDCSQVLYHPDKDRCSMLIDRINERWENDEGERQREQCHPNSCRQ